MGSCLVVGQLPNTEAQDGARAYLAQALDAPAAMPAHVELCKVWDAAPAELACIDALNEASTSAFLGHTAMLEGLANANEALARSRWRHLPYWIESYWLPVRGGTMLHEPVFFGSAYGLLDNLADIAAISPHGLGTAPPHFELMRTDLQAFYALKLDAFDEATTLQWVWRALFEAATLSVDRNVPMWSG
jgi:hypothetical protein